MPVRKGLRAEQETGLGKTKNEIPAYVCSGRQPKTEVGFFILFHQVHCSLVVRIFHIKTNGGFFAMRCIKVYILCVLLVFSHVVIQT